MVAYSRPPVHSTPKYLSAYHSNQDIPKCLLNPLRPPIHRCHPNPNPPHSVFLTEPPTSLVPVPAALVWAEIEPQSPSPLLFFGHPLPSTVLSPLPPSSSFPPRPDASP